MFAAGTNQEIEDRKIPPYRDSCPINASLIAFGMQRVPAATSARDRADGPLRQLAACEL